MVAASVEYYYVVCNAHGFFNELYATKESAILGLVNHSLKCNVLCTIYSSHRAYCDETYQREENATTDS